MSERDYLALMADILANGEPEMDRTGVGTRSVFGRQLRFDLREGFPLLTTKRMFTKGIVAELMFFLKGLTNTEYLQLRGVRIWDEWQDINGNLGPIYSHQWRNFGGKPDNVVQPKPRLPEGLAPTIYGVANADIRPPGELAECLFILWKGLISRCYNKNKSHYKYYGLKGVSVVDSWLVFENFFRDVQQLPGWQDKRADWGNFALDKDTLGDGFVYGPQWTQWLSNSENCRAKDTTLYTIYHEDTGEEITFLHPADVYTRHNLHQGNFCSMLRGDRPVAQGWRLISSKDLSRGVDQIQQLLVNLKTNPGSRRHVISAWNPAEIDQMALPPCHCLFQFKAYGQWLDCQLYQRSGDYLLGVPTNIASYSLLTHLVAAHVGLKPRFFIHSFGDVHLYNNHVEQARLQLTREPRPFPQVKFTPRPNIDDYVISDFTFEGYDPWPVIKAPVAV